MMFFASLPTVIPPFRRFRLRFDDLALCKCPRKALRCFAFPEAVILNRFFIALCVFCLGIDLITNVNVSERQIAREMRAAEYNVA